MHDGLDIERFRDLAECYGANIDCWPQEIRRPAARLIARLPEARDIIAGEKALDITLSAWSVPAIPHDLERQMSRIATASGQQFIRKMKIWWASIGIAAALSGVTTGAMATVLFSQAPQSYSSTVFGDVDDGDN
ncbi:hypothetical protein [Neorhizobium sp. NCHU2750]|uniref:hypothetical protein n=1 Tax=Neorhizobium sp. NCHU2750 TaxID=1825976 RepID=UPI000E750D9D|nr:hypothetical protein NCHU2750_53470 [Neorhizobium sp. NCHU2750]